MNRTELIAATTAILFVAFILGWFVSWLMHRFTRVTQSDLGEVDHLAQQVHEAEEARDAAQTEMREREKDLTNRLAQTQAELSAAMDALRGKRAEVEELRETLDSFAKESDG